MLPDRHTCVGCGVCIAVCPANCISFDSKSEAFRQIMVCNEACIDCGICEKRCPVLNTNTSSNRTLNEVQVYACHHKDAFIRHESSSGGFFTALCEGFFYKYKGTVYGASLQEDLTVKHIPVRTKDELKKIRGAKYIQSDLTEVFSGIKVQLKNEEYILFSGTPCQIAALYEFLGKKYRTLFTCEVICHGVASSSLFEMQNTYFESKYGSPVKDVSFRSKSICWTMPTTCYRFSNGMEKYFRANENLLMRTFYNGLSLRPACYNCRYASIPRAADLTMGDFWKLSLSDLYTFTEMEKGVSLVLSNNNVGDDLFSMATSNLIYEKRDIREAIKGNIHLIRPTSTSVSEFSYATMEELKEQLEYLYPLPRKEKMSLKLGHRFAKVYHYLKHRLIRE